MRSGVYPSYKTAKNTLTVDEDHEFIILGYKLYYGWNSFELNDLVGSNLNKSNSYGHNPLA